MPHTLSLLGRSSSQLLPKAPFASRLKTFRSEREITILRICVALLFAPLPSLPACSAFKFLAAPLARASSFLALLAFDIFKFRIVFKSRFAFEFRDAFKFCFASKFCAASLEALAAFRVFVPLKIPSLSSGFISCKSSASCEISISPAIRTGCAWLFFSCDAIFFPFLPKRFSRNPKCRRQIGVEILVLVRYDRELYVFFDA